MKARHVFARPPIITAREAKIAMQDGAVIIDVRGAREYNRAHIPGALHIPLSELASRAEEIPEDIPVITFCTGGLLSGGAANLLIELGFTASNMARGLIEWRSVGGPLESSGGPE